MKFTISQLYTELFHDTSHMTNPSTHLYFYVHKVERKGLDIFPSLQTYATAAFGEGRVHEGPNRRLSVSNNSSDGGRCVCL